MSLFYEVILLLWPDGWQPWSQHIVRRQCGLKVVGSTPTKGRPFETISNFVFYASVDVYASLAR